MSNEQKNDGGRAFPRSYTRDDMSGMTLRDYFAAKALQAFLSVPDSIQAMGEAAEAGGEDKAAFAAGMAYEIADSMLAERAK